MAGDFGENSPQEIARSKADAAQSKVDGYIESHPRLKTLLEAYAGYKMFRESGSGGAGSAYENALSSLSKKEREGGAAIAGKRLVDEYVEAQQAYQKTKR